MDSDDKFEIFIKNHPDLFGPIDLTIYKIDKLMSLIISRMRKALWSLFRP